MPFETLPLYQAALSQAQTLLGMLPPEVQVFLLQPVWILEFPMPVWSLIAAGLAVVLICYFLKLLLRPRYYFFVRHGQTVLNAERIRQGAEGALTEAGVAQAERTGEFLSPFRIRKIYASPYERTRQTADIINKYLHCRITYSPLLAERRNPSEVIGKSSDDPAIRAIGDKIDLTFHDDNYRNSDEENFADLKKRAATALRYLKHKKEPRILVVTHGIFLKMLISYLLYGNDLHAHDWVKLSFFSPADNAGMTLCIYRPLRRFTKTGGWEILSYNITIPTKYSDAIGHGIANLNDLKGR